MESGRIGRYVGSYLKRDKVQYNSKKRAFCEGQVKREVVSVSLIHEGLSSKVFGRMYILKGEELKY